MIIIFHLVLISISKEGAVASIQKISKAALETIFDCCVNEEY